MEQVSIRTGDGECRSYVFTPDGTGSWPAVILYMDGLAIRPALMAMADRMAKEGGYVVLMPDLYYRVGPYESFDPKQVFGGGDVMAAIGKYFTSTDNGKAATDTRQYLDYLSTRKDVSGDKVGTTGYCMGGAMSMTAQATYPGRIVASASFHGGNLAGDDPLSPHLLADKMKGRIYVAAAVDDPFYPVEMHEKLEQTLTEAKVDYKAEFYEGALHGWTMTDFPIYNENQAEHHWRELFGLFKSKLS